MDRRQALRLATVVLGGIVSPGVIKAALSDPSLAATAGKGLLGDLERQILSVLTELIIPTTTTPGAIAAGVPEFVEGMVRDWYTKKERSIFLRGLADIETYSRENFQLNFTACTAQQQTDTLSHFETLSKAYKSAVAPAMTIADTDEETPFFTKIKELTVLGYFSSEVGIKESLAYNPMPMEYKADIPLADVDGKQWAQY